MVFVNKTENQFLMISAFAEKDKSSYLEINSGLKRNYFKFSYHPKEQSFRLSFKQELWKILDENNIGQPNKKRIKSKIEKLPNKQHLCSILIDRSSLFRKHIPKNKDYLYINFKEEKILILDVYINNKTIIITHKFIDSSDEFKSNIRKERERIYKLNNKIDNSKITGIAQLVDDHHTPWKILCIGI